jgi:hypothetical protein
VRDWLLLVWIIACHPRAVIVGTIRALRWPSVSVIVEPRDLWVGVYWDVVASLLGNPIALDVYVCVVPCLPIRLTWGVPKDRRTLDLSDL